MEEDAFGADVYADLSPAQQQADELPMSGAAQSEAAAAPATDLGAAGGEMDEDLYGDLEAATIPQTDGAGDSPPRHRRRRSSGADPSERWEMGKDGEGEQLYCFPPLLQLPQLWLLLRRPKI
jgi:hypothetical protein